MQLCGYVDRSDVASVRSDSHLRVSSEEDARVWGARRRRLILNCACLTGSGERRIYSESAVDIPAGLVVFNCLPCIFCGVADSRPVNHESLGMACRLKACVCGVCLNLQVALVFAEPQWQVQLERAVRSTALRLVKSVYLNTLTIRSRISLHAVVWNCH